MTVRRLLVLGVCAVGVAALYLAPGLGRSPQLTAGPSRNAEPTGPGTPTASRGSSPPRPASPVSTPRPSASSPSSEPGGQLSRPHRTGGGATPFDPVREPDRSAPGPVRDLVPTAVSADRVTVAWRPASDNVAVTGYRVWLNGFEVATTTKTRATVRWFNDDLKEHVVQVKALDGAGNVSATSPTVLVARPTPGPHESTAPATPGPSTTPAPSASPSPSPSPSASATPTPAPSPSPSPADEPSPTPSLVPSASGSRT